LMNWNLLMEENWKEYLCSLLQNDLRKHQFHTWWREITAGATFFLCFANVASSVEYMLLKIPWAG
jgi:hypothetical protein